MRQVSLIPYVCGAGASTPGAEGGALYCFDHDMAEELRGRGLDAVWSADPKTAWSGPYGQVAHSNLPPRGTPERLEIVSWHLRSLAAQVETVTRGGGLAVTIGGDHSLAAGSVAGLRRALGPDARIGLLWIDAHTDINTEGTTISHALHGMPMATLLGIEQMMQIDDVSYPAIRPEDVFYFGLRDIDPGEYDNARDLGLQLMDIESLRAYGVAKAIREAGKALAACDAVVLSIDLDGFSTDQAPSVGTPVPGGFTFDEVVPMLADIVRLHPVALIDIVEFNPALDGADKTFRFMIDLVTGLFSNK